MPKPTPIAENVTLVATDKKNWDGQPLFELKIGDRVVGEIYRATSTTHIMAKSGNYSVGTRVKKGWEWRIKRDIATETGIVNSTFRRTTSYVLFTSKVKAATDLAELIAARTAHLTESE